MKKKNYLWTLAGVVVSLLVVIGLFYFQGIKTTHEVANKEELKLNNYDFNAKGKSELIVIKDMNSDLKLVVNKTECEFSFEGDYYTGKDVPYDKVSCPKFKIGDKVETNKYYSYEFDANWAGEIIDRKYSGLASQLGWQYRIGRFDNNIFTSWVNEVWLQDSNKTKSIFPIKDSTSIYLDLNSTFKVGTTLPSNLEFNGEYRFLIQDENGWLVVIDSKLFWNGSNVYWISKKYFDINKMDSNKLIFMQKTQEVKKGRGKRNECLDEM